MRYVMIALAALSLLALGYSKVDAAEKTKIVFVAGKPSHAPGDHEHRAGCMLLARILNENMPNVEAVVTHYGWPEDNSIFEGASSVVIYCDGGKGHVLNENLEFFQGLIDKGVGLACIHYAVETTKGECGDKFLEWLGGYFEPDWSVNPHWDANYTKLPEHAITTGISPFEMNDEWYYHMRFVDGMKGITPILTALPPDSSLSRPDGPHSGNPAVRKAIANGEEQHMAWAYERPGGGRSFGFTGAHFHRNWKNDDFRTLVLNAIVWTAGLDVPQGGVPSTTPTAEEMKANLDDKGRR
ncbi:MAG: ThuA domain-containing protein [Candidatus Hydrogenedentes bacterium]|nr:ThuA domain-containing protein [Candidatus Hydrogenedentota bacterium]